VIGLERKALFKSRLAKSTGKNKTYGYEIEGTNSRGRMSLIKERKFRFVQFDVGRRGGLCFCPGKNEGGGRSGCQGSFCRK